MFFPLSILKETKSVDPFKTGQTQTICFRIQFTYAEKQIIIEDAFDSLKVHLKYNIIINTYTTKTRTQNVETV